ncbi:MAG: glycosyltransferase family 39 protein [Candidatus Aureabacteria bacterium]|nr:glycosyltransferase family 39 protein [Candidatus Auribacterota bacterium]
MHTGLVTWGSMKGCAPGRSSSRGLLILCILLAILVLLPPLLVFRNYPTRDSGGALYAGWRIIEGGVLYRDVWDHKGPLLYFLNALGLCIGRGSVWGVSVIECLFLGCAGVLGYAACKPIFGPFPATFGTAVWLLGLPLVLDGGNLTEEYALPLQWGALCLYSRFCLGRGTRGGAFAIGCIAGAAMLFRPNLGGTPLIAACCAVFTEGVSRRERAARAAAVLAGCAAVATPVLGYFALNDALGCMWDALMRYNLAYSAVPWTERRAALAAGIRVLTPPGVTILALTGWLCGAVGWRRSGGGGTAVDRFSRFLLVAAPVELLLSTTSGRPYRHYYISWLPVCGALAALAVYDIRARFDRGGFPASPARRDIFLGVIFLIFAMLPLKTVIHQLRTVPVAEAAHSRTASVAYLRASTRSRDTVLVWGAEPSVNFLSGRASPTRFSFAYPLLTRGYTDAGLVKSFVRELETSPPRCVIDASAGSGIVPPLDEDARRGWHLRDRGYEPLPSGDSFYELIKKLYRRRGELGPQGWILYTRVEP